MRRIFDRATIAFLGAAMLCLGGAIVVIVAYVVRFFAVGYESIESVTLAQLLSDVPFLPLGVTGALVGAMTGKAGIMALTSLGNVLVSAGEWCLKRSRRID